MKGNWTHLNKYQVGAYGEYFVKMEFTALGFQVYTPEVDDRGVDFVARYAKGKFIEVQVKAIRKYGYVFVRKKYFNLDPSRYLALVLLFPNDRPNCYLIPSVEWLHPNELLVDHDYEGKKSQPEYGINLNEKKKGLLQKYMFSTTVSEIVDGSA